MDDLGLIGGVISICVVLAVTIISIFQTKDRWRTDGRERLRKALVPSGANAHEASYWLAGQRRSRLRQPVIKLGSWLLTEGFLVRI